MDLRLSIAILQHHFGLWEHLIDESLPSDKQDSSICHLFTLYQMQIAQCLSVK